jgi:hypothetical protein
MLRRCHEVSCPASLAMADVSYVPGGRTAIVGDSCWALIDASAVANTRRRVTWTTVNVGMLAARDR